MGDPTQSDLTGVAPGGVQPPQAPPTRTWSGESKVQETIVEYTALVPADQDMEQSQLMRVLVADVLRRNGYPADPERITTITEANRRPDGNFDFDRAAGGSNMALRKHHPGATNANRREPGTGFDGYSVTLAEDFQNRILEWDKSLRGPPLADASEASYDKLIGIIEQLKRVAGSNENFGSAKEALDALAQALKAGQSGNALDGVGAGASTFKMTTESLKTIATFVDTIGNVPMNHELAMEGAELMGRSAAILTLPVDAAKVYTNMYKLWHQVDENGKSLSATDSAKAVLELVDDGMSVTAGSAQLVNLAARGLGSSATEAAAGRVIGGLSTYAGPASAVLAWVELNREVVRLGGEAIQSTMEVELRARFGSEGGTQGALARLEQQQQRVAEMPISGNNARSTAERIMRDTFSDSDTQQRFIDYLKKKIDPDVAITRIVSGRDIDQVSAADMSRIAKEAKEAVPGFIKSELQDVKDFVLKKGEKERGEYLRSSVEETNEPPRNRAEPGDQLREQVRARGESQASERGLSAQQWENMSAALTVDAVNRGMTRVDDVVWNKDGRVFAVEGQRDAPDRRIAFVDQAAVNQPVEQSRQQLAQATQLQATQDVAVTQDAAQRGGRAV